MRGRRHCSNCPWIIPGLRSKVIKGGASPSAGERCQGNTSCTPICPAHAKYNANKTMAQADAARLRILAQTVASRINIDPATGAVRSITCKRYDGSGIAGTYTVSTSVGSISGSFDVAFDIASYSL